MAVRTVCRRGERRLVIDIRYRNQDGTRGRFRRDAEVQTLPAARAEERRRLMLLATTGTPWGTFVNSEEKKEEPPAAPLFEDVVKTYLATYAKTELKPSTRHGYLAVIDGVLLPRFGKMRIDEIDLTKVRVADAELVEAGTAPSTRRNMQIVLRSIICRYAVEAGLLADAPRMPPLPKVGIKIVKVLTAEEVRRIIGASSGGNRRAFMLAAFAGLRSGEIRALRRSDVDLQAGTLTVRSNRCRGVFATPKSGHERLVPLTSELQAELASLDKSDPSSFICPTRKGGPRDEHALLKSFKCACAKAGVVTTWRFHDLRHFFVTSLFRAGTPAPAVQALAGHADLSTTQRYAHATAADLRDAISRLGETVGQRPSRVATSARKPRKNSRAAA